MSHGDFMNMTDEDAWNFLEEMAEKTMQWEGFREKAMSAITTEKGGLHQVETSIAAEAKFVALARRVKELEEKRKTVKHEQVNQVSQRCCFNYQGTNHVMEECPFMPNQIGNTLEQMNVVFQRQRNDPFSQTYNPGWKNHPNFSWAQGGFQGTPQGHAQFAGPN